jgi:hypothetical protein
MQVLKRLVSYRERSQDPERTLAVFLSTHQPFGPARLGVSAFSHFHIRPPETTRWTSHYCLVYDLGAMDGLSSAVTILSVIQVTILIASRISSWIAGYPASREKVNAVKSRLEDVLALVKRIQHELTWDCLDDTSFTAKLYDCEQTLKRYDPENNGFLQQVLQQFGPSKLDVPFLRCMQDLNHCYNVLSIAINHGQSQRINSMSNNIITIMSILQGGEAR